MNEPLLHPTERVPELVGRLYALVGEFQALFPGRSFTPDGHLVGSIGEVLAAYRYNLLLHTASKAGHDAVARDGRQVEVKATQGSSVALRSEPEHLLVLHLGKDGRATEIYNGPGATVWERCGRMQPNGQRAISLFRLRELMSSVPSSHRLPLRDA